MLQCFLPGKREFLSSKIESVAPDENLLITLSVRSGFDLLWSTLDLEPGSEVIFSGLTISDMPKIVAEYGLRSIPVDLDLESMAPSADEIRDRLTPKTRAIVIAHLWGGLVDLTEIAEIARENGVLLIEDCAQAFVGTEFWGDHRADVSMFSFGSIKTNTALGGAVIRVGDAELLKRMDSRQRNWPVQARRSYFVRLMKYLALKLMSVRWMAALLFAGLRWLGKSHDSLVAGLARGFSGGQFFSKIRHQPSAPLLKMLHRRLVQFDADTVQRRTELGERFIGRIREMEKSRQPRECSSLLVVGEKMKRPTFWVLAVLVDEPYRLVKRLVEAGFDATQKSSMRAIDSGKCERNQLFDCCLVEKQMVILPIDCRMQAREIEKMAELVGHVSPTSWEAVRGDLDSEVASMPSAAR